METQPPSQRRQFIKESGATLLAMAGLASAAAPAASAQEAGGAAPHGAQGTIILRRNDGGALTYMPAPPATDAGRGAALRSALADARDGDVVEIRIGRCAVAGGPLVGSLPKGVAGVRLVFGEHAAIVYEDPQQAAHDSVLFPDSYRNVRWFGAHTYPEPGPSVEDSWNAFEAAKLSLAFNPAIGGLDEERNPIRGGVVDIPSGRYFLSKPLKTQGNQTWKSDGGAVLRFGAGLAPAAGGRKHAWTVLRTLAQGADGPTGQANFTHGVVIKGIGMHCEEAGNERLCAMLYAGAQMSALDVQVDSFPGGGVEFLPFCDFVDIRLSACRIKGNEFGGLYALAMNNCTLDLSLVAINRDATCRHADPLAEIIPAMELKECVNLLITNVLFEQTPFGCFLKDCYSIQMPNASGGLEAAGPHKAHYKNARVIEAVGGTNHSYQGFFRNFDVILNERSAFTNGLVTVDAAGGLLDFHTGTARHHRLEVVDLHIGRPLPDVRDFSVNCASVFHEEARFKSPVNGAVKNVQATADPTPDEIPEQATVPWYNSTTGEHRLWTKIGGVLRKGAPFV